MAKTTQPETQAETLVAQASLNDNIAHNRAVSPIEAQTVPQMSPHYRATDAATRRKTLRYVDQEQRPELYDVLAEIAGKPPDVVRAELGDLIPDVRLASPLLGRMKATYAPIIQLQAALAGSEELDAIAQNDAVLFVEALHEEYLHRVRKVANLAQKYPALVRFFEQRTGKALAGRLAKAAEKAAAGGETDKSGEK